MSDRERVQGGGGGGGEEGRGASEFRQTDRDSQIYRLAVPVVKYT